ncbi:unnamed protein product [Oncorhynchus mykiss]|uniref:Uncharacterized protein n=1 Tax=Oncorhynchus mykiss TaxID=8022 RepID=A0A060YQJ5_ONCMY|nr:unnamed protein product [Oncorhynchus mykiss]
MLLCPQPRRLAPKYIELRCLSMEVSLSLLSFTFSLSLCPSPDPSELKAPGPSDWSISENQSGKGAGFPQRNLTLCVFVLEPSGERSKKTSDAAGVETSPANITVADSTAESKVSSEMGYGNRCTQPKGPRDPPTQWT